MTPPVCRVPADAQGVEPRCGLGVADRSERLIRNLPRPERIRLAHQDHVGEPGERLPFEDAVADTRRLLAHRLHLARDRGQVVEAPGRLRSEVPALEGRLELQGAQERVARSLIRLPGERASSRLLERRRCLARQVGRRSAVEVGEKRSGMVEVVRPDLEQLVSRPLAEPLGEARMVCRPRGLREARVRDVADEDVLEAIGLLVGERRARLVDDEVSQLEVLESVLDAVTVRQMLDRAGPEAPADHRCPLHHRLRSGVEPVDASRDQRLQACPGSPPRPAPRRTRPRSA